MTGLLSGRVSWRMIDYTRGSIIGLKGEARGCAKRGVGVEDGQAYEIRLHEIFQSIPIALCGDSSSWINESDFFKRVTHPAEITGRTRKYDVFEIIISSSCVWQDMVILCPHSQKRAVTAYICFLESHRFRIGIFNPCPYFATDYRHSAKPAMVPIALMYFANHFGIRHSD